MRALSATTRAEANSPRELRFRKVQKFLFQNKIASWIHRVISEAYARQKTRKIPEQASSVADFHCELKVLPQGIELADPLHTLVLSSFSV
jgi:hypothetical protein